MKQNNGLKTSIQLSLRLDLDGVRPARVVVQG